MLIRSKDKVGRIMCCYNLSFLFMLINFGTNIKIFNINNSFDGSNLQDGKKTSTYFIHLDIKKLQFFRDIANNSYVINQIIFFEVFKGRWKGGRDVEGKSP